MRFDNEHIRTAVKSDSANLAALSLQVWLDTYAVEGIRDKISDYALSAFTPSNFSDLIAAASHDILLYTENDHLVGFVAVNLTSEFESPKNGYEVATLYVSAHFQGKGIGKALLKALIKRYGAPFWLATWCQNSGGLDFYRHLKFVDIGKLNFDLDGELFENVVLRCDEID